MRRKKYVARFSNVSLLASVAPKRPGWRRHLTFALLIAGLAVLALGAAQPTAAVHVPRDRATVMMAIDVSESMRADDVLPTRLQAAQQAAKQFADLLPPRINLGLVKFSGTASVLVPPTIDRDSVKVAIDGLELDRAHGHRRSHIHLSGCDQDVQQGDDLQWRPATTGADRADE